VSYIMPMPHYTSNLSSSLIPAKILILGIGDLGAQIARLVVENGYASTCMLAGQSGAAEQCAQLLHLSSGRDVRGRRVDGQDVEALKKLLADFEPDLIVQCATLISPFKLPQVGTAMALAVLKGGFALQIAAQLPVIRSVMQARRAVGLSCPVINCSYPDVTNPLLAAEGLAPTVGIGNVAIMAMRFQRLIAGATDASLRVVGHHAQLAPSLAGDVPVPMVYLNGRKLEEQELLFKTGLQPGSTLNYLAAATVRPLLHGLLDRDSVTDAHAPGVFGLQGGYPVRFAGGEMSLNLPDCLSLDEAVGFNVRSAVREGIERIGEDGTLFYTGLAREAVAPWCPGLAEPFRPSDIETRLQLLESAVRS
jgi:hypothetical protein